jgi:GNAT superfamily N-acetyltransferase
MLEQLSDNASTTTSPIFSRQRIADCWDEAKNLIVANHAETGTFDASDFSPNPEFYLDAEANGRMVLFTMRLEGKLIGYQTFALFPYHPRYLEAKNLALQDVMYVAPEHRGIAVLHFILFVDGELRRDGWRPIRHSSAKKNISGLLLHADYEPLEQTFIKKESP